MSSLFSKVLGVGAVLITAVVCAGTLVFLLIKQSEQISSVQNSLYKICINNFTEHLQANHPDSQDSGVEEETE